MPARRAASFTPHRKQHRLNEPSDEPTDGRQTAGISSQGTVTQTPTSTSKHTQRYIYTDLYDLAHNVGLDAIALVLRQDFPSRLDRPVQDLRRAKPRNNTNKTHTDGVAIKNWKTPPRRGAEVQLLTRNKKKLGEVKKHTLNHAIQYSVLDAANEIHVESKLGIPQLRARSGHKRTTAAVGMLRTVCLLPHEKLLSSQPEAGVGGKRFGSFAPRLG